MSLTYLSVCSGIEAATVAWEPLGFRAIAFSEIEPFPCEVLRHHYPHIPNLGDMTAIDGTAFRGKVDILVGGTPCRNVRLHVFSSKDNAFGGFPGREPRRAQGLPVKICHFSLQGASARWGGLGRPDCVLGPKRTVAWRIFDAQFFELAQRRNRVFVVACPADEVDPTQVLFEFEGVRRDSPQRLDAIERAANRGKVLPAALTASRERGVATGRKTRAASKI